MDKIHIRFTLSNSGIGGVGRCDYFRFLFCYNRVCFQFLHVCFDIFQLFLQGFTFGFGGIQGFLVSLLCFLHLLLGQLAIFYIVLMVNNTPSYSRTNQQQYASRHAPHGCLVGFECLLAEGTQAAAQANSAHFIVLWDDEPEFRTIDRQLYLIAILQVPLALDGMTIEEGCIGLT